MVTNPPVLASWRFVLVASSCGRSAIMRSPPKICRTESHRHSSRPLVPRSRAAWRRLTVRIGLDRRFEGNAPSRKRDFAAMPSGGEELRPPTPAKPAPTAPLRSGSCHGLCFHPPTRKKCSAAHEAREKGEPACVAEGSIYEPPAALIAAWLERDVFEREKENQRKRGRQRVPPAAESGRPGGAGWRVVAASSGPAMGRLPLLRDGGARLCWRRARQPTNAAANSPRSTRRCRFHDRGASHGINRAAATRWRGTQAGAWRFLRQARRLFP